MTTLPVITLTPVMTILQTPIVREMERRKGVGMKKKSKRRKRRRRKKRKRRSRVVCPWYQLNGVQKFVYWSFS